jgi:cytidine deaminase
MHIDAPEAWKDLSTAAWLVRENAVAIRTKVGAAVQGRREHGDRFVNLIFRGCNIEDLWKASSIHAERSALAAMVSAGCPRAEKILIAAERERLTPCGNCMDFLMQFGGPELLVAFQPSPDAAVNVYTAAELMPHYPR